MVPGKRKVGEKGGHRAGRRCSSDHRTCLVVRSGRRVHSSSIGRSGGGKRDVRADDGMAFFEKGEHEGV